MNRLLRPLVLSVALAGGLVATPAYAAPDLETLHRLAFEALKSSYPDLNVEYDGGSLVVDGTRYPLTSGPKTAQQLLDDPDWFDQFAYLYPTRGTPLPTSVTFPQDPGRVRVEALFRQIYGPSPGVVKPQLVVVPWVPSAHGGTLPVTSRNGVAGALQRVSQALDQRPDLWPFLVNPGGSYYWRVIAGTERLSVHSFGIAVDINVARSDYWRSFVTDEAAPVAYRNRIPQDVVEIFEDQGFIWGGWWYHFDTMHFEYRPELIAYQRLLAAAKHEGSGQ